MLELAEKWRKSSAHKFKSANSNQTKWAKSSFNLGQCAITTAGRNSEHSLMSLLFQPLQQQRKSPCRPRLNDMILCHLPNLAISRGIQEIMPCPSKPADCRCAGGSRRITAKVCNNKTGVTHQLKIVKLVINGIALKLWRGLSGFLLNKQQTNQFHVAFHSDVVMRANNDYTTERA